MREEAELYDAGYFSGHGYGIDPQRARAYRQEIGRIRRYKRSGTALDIGCGTGDFTAMLGEGWTKYGIEISDYAASLARQKGIKIVRKVDLYGRDDFDLIVLRGSLQHLDHPFETLNLCRIWLKDDGVLAIIATPNADSLCYKLFGSLPALDPERNWWVPGAKELCNVLEHLGFEIIETRYPYLGGPYARPLRDLGRFLLRLFGVKSRFAFPGNMMEIYARPRGNNGLD